jgi:hypothetical protein
VRVTTPSMSKIAASKTLRFIDPFHLHIIGPS